MTWITDNLMELDYGFAPKYDHVTQVKIRAFCRKGPTTHCVHCGGIYKNPSYCRYINNEFYHCCQLCNIIAEFKPINTHLVSIYKSKISQLDIIKQTVEYIVKYKKIPNISDIDTHATIVKIKPVKFFKLYEANDEKVNNYKVFFTSDINIANIVLRFVSSEPECVYVDANTLNAIDTYDIKIITIMERINRWNKKFIESSSEETKYINTLMHMATIKYKSV